MIEATINGSNAIEISRLAERYLWWTPVAEDGFGLSRQIAQIMHLGTYDDIRRLESLVDGDGLAAVMTGSSPGWFDDRSWGFWRGRLCVAGDRQIPENRPKRTFADAAF